MQLSELERLRNLVKVLIMHIDLAAKRCDTCGGSGINSNSLCGKCLGAGVILTETYKCHD